MCLLTCWWVFEWFLVWGLLWIKYLRWCMHTCGCWLFYCLAGVVLKTRVLDLLSRWAPLSSITSLQTSVYVSICFSVIAKHPEVEWLAYVTRLSLTFKEVVKLFFKAIKPFLQLQQQFMGVPAAPCPYQPLIRSVALILAKCVCRNISSWFSFASPLPPLWLMTLNIFLYVMYVSPLVTLFECLHF